MDAQLLRTTYCDLELKNPIIAASGGTTMNYERCKRAEDAGFAAVVLKSVQEELIMRYNPNPRFELIHHGIPGYSSDTFYCYEQAFENGIDEYCEEIVRCKNGLEIPTIASINCINPETWEEYAIACEQAGADALEIVTSCPSGLLMRSGKDIVNITTDALERTKSAVNIPVGVKMTMQLSNPLAFAITLADVGADTLILYNRFTGCEIDIETMAPILHQGFAGHGGPWVKLLNMRWMIETWPHLSIPISAVGGITQWEDVIKYILCGASNVQVCSLIYLKGYDCVTGLLNGISDYLEEHKISHITDLIGAASTNLVDNLRADRSKRYYAFVDKEFCIKCGKCADVCLYDALEYGVEGPVIDENLCDGCNMCVAVCKSNAIAMRTHNSTKKEIIYE
jgi:dihydroorotate dehydrogenase subfamily 1